MMGCVLSRLVYLENFMSISLSFLLYLCLCICCAESFLSYKKNRLMYDVRPIHKICVRIVHIRRDDNKIVQKLNTYIFS